MTRDELRRRIRDVLDSWTSGPAAPTAAVMKFVGPVIGERDRYRLAWLSARRRAADEANLGMEALELKNQEITRLRAALDVQRQTFDAPRLECVGEDEDGPVYKLAESPASHLPPCAP